MVGSNALCPLAGKTVAVTGASGFIGSHLVRELLGCGASVVALYPEDQAPRLEDMKGPLEKRYFDLADPQQATSAIAGVRPEVVFHLAAYGVQARDRELERAIAVNVAGAAAVVSGAHAARSRRVIQIGTSHEYGGADGSISEEAPLEPTGIYGATKAAGMVVGRARARELGVPWTGLRPFVTYGPAEDEEKLVPYVITRALRGEPVTTTAGEQIRDLTYVEDLVHAMALAACADLPPGEVLNLGSGEPRRLLDVLRLLAQILPTADIRPGQRPPRPDDVSRQVADVSKQRRLLPWRPEVTLERGLRRTVEFYAARVRAGAG